MDKVFFTTSFVEVGLEGQPISLSAEPVLIALIKKQGRHRNWKLAQGRKKY